MVTDIYRKEEGEFLRPMNIPRLLDDLVMSPTGGLDPHNANAAHDYLDILTHALKAESARHLSLLLTVLLNTTSKSLLTKIFVKQNGLQVLAAMLIIHHHSFQMTPILRITLRVLRHLENRQVLRGADLTCAAPHFCTHDFSQILYDLTRHPDPRVHALAKTFQKGRVGLKPGGGHGFRPSSKIAGCATYHDAACCVSRRATFGKQYPHETSAIQSCNRDKAWLPRVTACAVASEVRSAVSRDQLRPPRSPVPTFLLFRVPFAFTFSHEDLGVFPFVLHYGCSSLVNCWSSEGDGGLEIEGGSGDGAVRFFSTHAVSSRFVCVRVGSLRCAPHGCHRRSRSLHKDRLGCLHVTGFLAGERNYAELHGDTGPLVYPAGFLYIYSGIKYITGGAVFPAQIVFGILYIINLGLVLLIYIRAQAVPWWALSLLCLSKRVHSIFVLRLFNDCFATTLTHASIALMQQQHWHLALAVFSAAVSVKMNVLLLAPPLLLLLLKSLTIWGVLTSLACAAIFQLLVGMPFLLTYPVEYLSRAFNLGRVFIHFWSVNFKFVPEDIFISKPFALSLLILHLGFLFLFAQYKWCRHEGGILQASGPKEARKQAKKSDLNVYERFLRPQQFLSANHILTVLFTGNFIGVVFARSLHYQFYSWYFYSLPFLLWKTTFPTPVRLAIFIAVELCWNVYPSTAVSSVVLLLCHISLLGGLWFSPSEYPYEDRNKEIKKVD